MKLATKVFALSVAAAVGCGKESKKDHGDPAVQALVSEHAGQKSEFEHHEEKGQLEEKGQIEETKVVEQQEQIGEEEKGEESKLPEAGKEIPSVETKQGQFEPGKELQGEEEQYQQQEEPKVEQEETLVKQEETSIKQEQTEVHQEKTEVQQEQTEVQQEQTEMPKQEQTSVVQGEEMTKGKFVEEIQQQLEPMEKVIAEQLEPTLKQTKFIEPEQRQAAQTLETVQLRISNLRDATTRIDNVSERDFAEFIRSVRLELADLDNIVRELMSTL